MVLVLPIAELTGGIVFMRGEDEATPTATTTSSRNSSSDRARRDALEDEELLPGV
jgi:hypothetical protein